MYFKYEISLYTAWCGIEGSRDREEHEYGDGAGGTTTAINKGRNKEAEYGKTERQKYSNNGIMV